MFIYLFEPLEPQLLDEYGGDHGHRHGQDGT